MRVHVPKFPLVKADRRTKVTDVHLGVPLEDKGDHLLTSFDRIEQRRADRARRRRP